MQDSEDGRYDCVVIGGGIIAAAAGQHLAAAGYRTLLAERDDYGSGTSSRTSRLQHCGLGYLSAAGGSLAGFLAHPLKALECLDLMRRSMRGRAEFVETSPERVRPVTFLVPLTRENAIPRWKAHAASRLMRASDGGRVPLDLLVLTAEEARALPALEGLAGLGAIRGAISFTEYQYVWPERIVVDTIMKARAIGLEALNHMPVTAIRRESDGWIVSLEMPGGQRQVRTRAVVNCAGVWVDEVTAMTGASQVRRNAGEKGTNIVLRLPPHMRGFGIETVTDSGAPFYLIPWGDLHYVGPWNSPSDGRPEGFRASEEEIAAILMQLGRMFPELPLDRDQVLYSWAGVRPRSLSPDGSGPSAAVMEHDLTSAGLPNVFTFTGGLLMTHREAGRRLTRAVRRRIEPSGAPRALDPTTPLTPDMSVVTERSVEHAVRQEQARTLEDILRRRLSVGWEADLGTAMAETAAKIAGPYLGWSEAGAAAQVKHFIDTTERDFGFIARTC